MSKLPVILDTDIGGDIDDTWALATLLNSPELDLRLVTTCTGDTTYRAQIVARMLEIAGRTDVPIGVGPKTWDPPERERQADWVEGYNLASYPGAVHADGVQALIDTVMAAGDVAPALQPVIIAIGPLTNLAVALAWEPRIAERCRVIGMQGSVHVGYDGSSEIHAEYNVKADVPAAQAVFTAPWDLFITPLDTCGLVRLRGEAYRAVHESADPLAHAVIQNYQAWAGCMDLTESSVLYDTVAVYLAFAEDLCEVEPRRLVVDDEGFTRVDEKGKEVRCALAWKDLPAFERLLTERLIRR
jgi:inosine-uridine nucleoside N-ribohydrolase